MLTTLVGLALLVSARSVFPGVLVMAYAAGADVLWRMTNAAVFWEQGKLLVILVALLSLRRTAGKRGPLPWIYLALMLPSALLTYVEPLAGEARKLISFNLSGPIALALSVALFSRLGFTRKQLRTIFFVFLAPMLGVAAIATSTTVSEAVSFGFESNVAASGGFGPNQVSSILGLGALLAFMLLLMGRMRPMLQIGLFGILVMMGSQSALTLSRSGLVQAVLAGTIGSLALLRRGRGRAGIIVLMGLVLLTANYALLPKLDNYTGGQLAKRFQDRDSTGRDSLFKADIRVWAEHPLLGVGPGNSRAFRGETQGSGVAHTEYSRMLAEHGSLGAIALVMLLIMALKAARSNGSVEGMAVSISLIVWALTFMGINGMRIAAPALLFGLASARLLPDDEGGSSGSDPAVIHPPTPGGHR